MRRVELHRQNFVKTKPKCNVIRHETREKLSEDDETDTTLSKYSRI